MKEIFKPLLDGRNGKNERHATAWHELTHRVSLCDAEPWLGHERLVTCGGREFRPDMHNAYVVYEMAHGFLVETVDGRGLHPQVVANSYRSLEGKVFDLAHFIKSYDPKNVKRDVVLGTIMAVELVGGNPRPSEGALGVSGGAPDTAREARALPESGWKVQPDRATAMGIRAVAVMHKQLDRVPEILETWNTGKINWKVSMEQDYPFDRESGIAFTSGWAIRKSEIRNPKSEGLPGELERFWESTPADMRELGICYVPCLDAPAELNRLLDPTTGAVKGNYKGLKCTILFGGLDGEVIFKGTGLCPMGAEPEAAVAQMLASEKEPNLGLAETTDDGTTDLVRPFKGLWAGQKRG